MTVPREVNLVLQQNKYATGQTNRVRRESEHLNGCLEEHNQRYRIT